MQPYVPLSASMEPLKFTVILDSVVLQDIKKLESEADAGSHRIVIVSYDLAKVRQCPDWRCLLTGMRSQQHMNCDPDAGRLGLS